MKLLKLACQTFGGIIKKEERKNFLAFAKLVAEHEREACARVCESLELPEWPDKVASAISASHQSKGTRMTKQEKAIREFCGHHADWWPSTTQVQEMLALAQPKQKYHRGDRLICLETEEYCGIHISGTDRQWVKFPDSHIGVYTNEQVAELFELLPKEPEQEPVAWITPDGEGFRIRFSPPVNDVPLGWDALYTTPPQRKSLLDEFGYWWFEYGSGLFPLEGEDQEEHAYRVATAAWQAAHGIKGD